MIDSAPLLASVAGMGNDLSVNIWEGEAMADNLLPRLTGPHGGEMLGMLTLEISERPGISPAFVAALMARIWAGLVTAAL